MEKVGFEPGVKQRWSDA